MILILLIDILYYIIYLVPLKNRHALRVSDNPESISLITYLDLVKIPT